MTATSAACSGCSAGCVSACGAASPLHSTLLLGAELPSFGQSPSQSHCCFKAVCLCLCTIVISNATTIATCVLLTYLLQIWDIFNWSFRPFLFDWNLVLRLLSPSFVVNVFLILSTLQISDHVLFIARKEVQYTLELT